MAGTERLPRARALTDYHSRSHDWPYAYSGQHQQMPQYQGVATLGYVPNQPHVQYSPINSNYSSCSPSYYHDGSQTAMHWSSVAPNLMQYSVRPPPRSATLPSQPRIHARSGHHSSSQLQQRAAHTGLRSNVSIDSMLLDTEEQDSENRDSKLSEPIEPAIAGYPKVDDFDELMRKYVTQLSPKKQDKALINAKRAANIKAVLIDKKTTLVESAQFRFWVKKMFQLQPVDSHVPAARKKICHEGKPVAIREKLFKILTRAHQKCQHGGRDKTSAQVRRVYSWVPKELISRFVKLCPTCRIRRGVNRANEPKEESPSPQSFEDTDTIEDLDSPIKTRQGSLVDVQQSINMGMPMQLVSSTSRFQNQNRWMSDLHTSAATYDGMYSSVQSTDNPSSFSAVNDLGGYDQGLSTHSGPLNTFKSISPTQPRPVSSHEPALKQESHYCYE